MPYWVWLRRLLWPLKANKHYPVINNDLSILEDLSSIEYPIKNIRKVRSTENGVSIGNKCELTSILPSRHDTASRIVRTLTLSIWTLNDKVIWVQGHHRVIWVQGHSRGQGHQVIRWHFPGGGLIQPGYWKIIQKNYFISIVVEMIHVIVTPFVM